MKCHSILFYSTDSPLPLSDEPPSDDPLGLSESVLFVLLPLPFVGSPPELMSDDPPPELLLDDPPLELLLDDPPPELPLDDPPPELLLDELLLLPDRLVPPPVLLLELLLL